MNVLITDDEKYMREELKDALDRVSPGNTCFFAYDYDSAMEVLKNNDIEIAFLDIHMTGSSGLDIAKEIKKMYPGINIIMVTAHEEYALHALKLFVSGYILKPVMDDELREVLNNLRNPVGSSEKKIRAKCFGNFDLFYNGKTITFTRQKEKELLAYLICLHGSRASRAEICAGLFEDKPEDKGAVYFRKIIQSLKKDLDRLGIGELLIHDRNSYAIRTDMLDCDYYDHLADKADAAGRYHGEFMNQYSWAERYIYELENY